VKIQCPYPDCAQSIAIEQSDSGRVANCPTCEREFQCPEIEPEEAQATTPTPPPIQTKQCPFCGEEILAHAKKCKHCGEMLDDALRTRLSSQVIAQPSAPPAHSLLTVQEITEYEAHPAMFRSQPIAFIFTILLCFAMIGFIPLIIWWLQTRGTTLTVTNKKTILRKGILSKTTTEVRHQDVRNIRNHSGPVRQ
jgi:hypothetical protein